MELVDLDARLTLGDKSRRSAAKALVSRHQDVAELLLALGLDFSDEAAQALSKAKIQNVEQFSRFTPTW